jgi:putative ATP-binding cassette transporter
MRKYRGFLKKYLKLICPYWYSKHKKQIRKWSISLIILIILQMILAVFVSQWTLGLFNALEVHSITGVLRQALALVVLFAGSVGISTAHTKIKRNLQMGLRTWLTDVVINKWMSNDAFYKLAIDPTDETDNPDGRIADDIKHAADGIINLFDSLLLAILLLISFTGILWGLSGSVVVFGAAISGYMVWLALLYAIVASVFGYFFSLPLTTTTNDMCTAEQNLRFELVEVKNNCGKIMLQNTQLGVINNLRLLIRSLREKYNIQTAAWMKIVQFHSGYGILSMAIPIIAAAPLYIAKSVTLGGLMQASQAFSQMVGALSWPVNNMAGIALWRTSVERVLRLVEAIDSYA